MLLLASLGAAPLGNLYAAQVLEAQSTEDELTASVSREDLNLIRVEGRKIRRVFGNDREFIAQPDKDTGSFYVKPITDKKFFSVFVADDSNRQWKLLLRVEDIPAESVVIKDRGRGTGKKVKAIGADQARTSFLKRILTILARGDEPEDMAIREMRQPIPLWNEADLVLYRILEGDGFRGESYQLTNKTQKPMVLDEREFYRQGVMAIAINKLELAPGETTGVYVVVESQNDR